MAATVGPLAAATVTGGERKKKPRVAAVFLQRMDTHEIWPYPEFDTAGRQVEVMTALAEGCPGVEFVPVTVDTGPDLKKALDMKEEVDGYLVYVMTLVWAQGPALVQIAQLGKPTLVADEFLGGSGAFLTSFSRVQSLKIPAAAVSSTRLDDLSAVAREFAHVGRPGATPESFAEKCWTAYRKTFAPHGDRPCIEDNVPLTEIGECVERFRESTFLIVGRGTPGQEHDFLGAKGRYVDFKELMGFYEKVDRDEAAEWALSLIHISEPTRPTT